MVVRVSNHVCASLRGLHCFGLSDAMAIGSEEPQLSVGKSAGGVLLGAVMAFVEDMIFKSLKKHFYYSNSSIIIVVALFYCTFVVDVFCFWKGIMKRWVVVSLRVGFIIQGEEFEDGIEFARRF